MSGRKGTRALELWCKRLVKDCPGVQIDNMTTCWRNGMAFCALVHHFRPDLIDMKSLNPEDVYENNKLAFTLAEKHLGIPALLDPEDMLANEVPDRLSVLTYLSQFYQRLGHTVNTKACESDVSLSPLTPASSSAPQTSSAIKFGKVNLDKCVSCGLPVYLAQRLIVLQKLYHRRCFRCTKCSGHLDPNKMETQTDTEMICESCKNEKPSRLMNEDQMGMIAFTDEIDHQEDEPQEKPTICEYPKRRPMSILERINMFEKESVDSKMGSLSLNESSMKKEKNESLIMRCEVTNSHKETSDIIENNTKESNTKVENQIETVKYDIDLPPKELNLYKNDVIKSSFLQTQLADIIDTSSDACDSGVKQDVSSQLEVTSEVLANDSINVLTNDSQNVLTNDSNITDDSRLANCTPTPDIVLTNCTTDKIENEQISINVPPRRKKQTNSSTKLDDKASSSSPNDKARSSSSPKKDKQSEDYPDHLNPFSDDDEDEPAKPEKKRESTNPFGSSDEEDEPERVTQTKPCNEDHSPQKRVVPANPFWSDGEEPTDDEESQDIKMHKSSITTSTPNLRFSTPRRAKPKAPPPPRITLTHALQDAPATSMDDIASLSSMSSYNSTVYSERSIGKVTPRMKKKRVAPTPPDSISTVSECSRDVTISEASRDVTASESARDVTVAASPARTSTPDKSLEHSSGNWRITKRPAPGLPLPERRQVKLQLSPGELQVQLDLLETQQLGLERQGVLIEQMIRDKCEGEEPVVVPQEEVEDLVIQLCELVNEKNDLFRKQTELMYIRRQQRLEQEQADIEHEIRVIQSRPAVNRIDADKAREEQLVSRLVEVVRLRDELVQQAECERRRERQEDLAIATSIATRRAQRNSASNSSSMKSDGQVTTVAPKKSKVKDKVKKQFKKAKHSLIPKRKDDQGESTKGEKSEKQKKAK